MMRSFLTNSLAMAALALVSGTAFGQASEDVLRTRTSFALDLDAADFTISDITKSGVRTDYVVTTKKGDRYRCYLTSASGLTKLMSGGENASDAMCRKHGEPAPSNALLDAAAKMQGK